MNERFKELINKCIENKFVYYTTTLENDNQMVVVFEKEDDSLSAFQIENEELAKIGEGRFRFYGNNKILGLDMIRVREDLRRQGIGKKMINCLLSFAKTAGCKKISLISATGSVGFYKKIGFDLVSPPDDHRTIVFEKQINKNKIEIQNEILF